MSQTLSPDVKSSDIQVPPSGRSRFLPGDTVHLKSGSPPLTVIRTVTHVFWVGDDGVRREDNFLDLNLNKSPD